MTKSDMLKPGYFAAVLLALTMCSSHSGNPKSAAAKVDASTLYNKFLFGYQGWFATPTDGSELKSWNHWTKDRGEPQVDNMEVDLWPDLSEFSAQELFPTPLRLENQTSAPVFSSYNSKTVERHFQWMKDYGLHGVFLQRFLQGLSEPSLLHFRNRVLQNVISSSQETGRVFALMYDISGANSETLVQDIIADWKNLIDEMHLLESDRYLHHRGRPLLAIWGFGFRDRKVTPAQAARLIAWFAHDAPEKYRATLMGGVPAHWRKGGWDASPDPNWDAVYRSFSVLSPWMVGRVRSNESIAKFVSDTMKEDLEETKRLGIDYLPVVFPGFSWANLKSGPINEIPRAGGRFYWRQINQYLSLGNKMLYGAMFDEMNEGTAIMKTAVSAHQLPIEPKFLALDADGYKVPSDWYLKISGFATSILEDRQSNVEDFPLQTK